MHYSKADMVAAIRAVGINPGDVVMLHTSLGRLGMMDGCETYTGLVEQTISAFREVVDEFGTILVPTYSYSIGRGDTFDVDNTPSAIGEFSELVRQRFPLRSADPMMSCCGQGPQAEWILRDISNECYGRDSVFDNFTKADGVVCTLGLGLWWATYCHYIERMANAPFRFNKRFTGTIREGDTERKEEWIYFAAPRRSEADSNSRALEAAATSVGIVNVASLGRSEIHACRAQELLACGVSALSTNPWLTAKGPPIPLEALFAGEEQWQPGKA